MSGKASEAGAKAAKWIAAEMEAGRRPLPSDVMARFELSRSQARRISAQVGLPALPVGRPAVA